MLEMLKISTENFFEKSKNNFAIFPKKKNFASKMLNHVNPRNRQNIMLKYFGNFFQNLFFLINCSARSNIPEFDKTNYQLLQKNVQHLSKFHPSSLYLYHPHYILYDTVHLSHKLSRIKKLLG